MLGYRRVNIIATICFLATLIVLFEYSYSFWWLLSIIIPYQLLLIYGSASVQSGFYLRTYNSNPEKSSQVALTFDDGPHPEYTSALLDILAKHEVKATFFLIGKNMEGHEMIVKRMHEEGHIIGNHTWSHTGLMPFWPWKKLREDIEKTNQKIEEITGVKPELFRPPFGVTSPRYRKALDSVKMPSIGWSIRSIDTVHKSPEKLLNRIHRDTYKGEVILFHDTWPGIVPFIDMFLEQLLKSGNSTVTVDSLFEINSYEK